MHSLVFSVIFGYFPLFSVFHFFLFFPITHAQETCCHRCGYISFFNLSVRRSSQRPRDRKTPKRSPVRGHSGGPKGFVSNDSVDHTEYFENAMGTERALSQASAFKNISREHKSWLKCTLVVGLAKEITSKHVVVQTKSGDVSLEYDILAVAPGFEYPVFKSTSLQTYKERQQYWEYTEGQLKKAKSVLVVGGNSTGVETAAFIAALHPHVKVTIIHARERLYDTSPIAVSDHLLNFLNSKNVDVIFNSKVNLDDYKDWEDLKLTRQVYKTTTGHQIEADLVIKCVNGKPNTQMFLANFGSAVNEKGLLKTRPTLQLEGHDNIFVTGDISNLPHNHAYGNLEPAIKVALANITAFAKGEPVTATYASNGFPAPAFTTISLDKVLVDLTFLCCACCICESSMLYGAREGFTERKPNPLP